MILFMLENAFFAACITYWMFAFIGKQMNPLKWSDGMRFSFCFVLAVMTVILCFAASMSERAEQRQREYERDMAQIRSLYP